MSDYYSYASHEPEPCLEDSELYKLLRACSKASIRDAWRLVGTMSVEDIKLRSTKDRSTYLHLLVNVVPEVHKKFGEITMLIPLIYRLALRGIRVNAQNEHGNTCLHLACLKPHAHVLYPHLIRIGCDPCMKNKKECRVIHTYRNHQCSIVKGQLSAKSGLWNAVEKEDKELVQKLLKSWCRVRVKKNKYLKNVADETANIYIIKLLDQYELPNEVACTAFSCDVPRLKELLARGGVDLNMRDEACDVAKPLVVAIEELGEIGRATVKVLKTHGATDSSDFPSEVQAYQSSFEESEFYQLIERGSEASICEALDMITEKRVDVNLISYREETNGWNYMHYTIDRYLKIKADDEEKSRLIVRGMYRLALAGIDVNARDHNGDTPLVKASLSGDQNLITHVLRLGGDASMTDKEGRAVSVYVYEDKGKMVFDRKYRIADLPGLWVAIDSNDVDKAKRWCKSWARVNTRRGDRRMLDVARALKRTEIVCVLEQHEHINEFVTATFASDIRAMTNTIALGKGGKKTNTIDEFFHVGYTWDRHAEFIFRPIIISAMDLCTPEVVDFLLKFGANLSKEHEENPPCGPIAFWAFHDHVSNENALVVAKHADIELRDELGCTMLHRAIRKNRPEKKVEIVLELLDRGIDLAARDYEGSTARDYIAIYDVADAYLLRQTMDDFILNLVNDEQTIQLENLLVAGYDHVLDITGLRRNRVVSARDIAVLKEYKDIIELFDDWEEYQSNIRLLHESAKNGDLKTISKISSEKRYSYGLDKAGRSLLHQAVLYQQPSIVEFICEQHPNLINSKDSLKRIPLHLCVCLKERHLIWPLLQDAGADPNLVDVNALSVYDYVRELETPTAPKDKPRGRRWRNYKPDNVIVTERNQDYGGKAARHELAFQLRKLLKDAASLKDVQALTRKIKADLSLDSLDAELLRGCVENQRSSVAQHLMETCYARVNPQVRSDEEGTVSLLEFAENHNCDDLVTYIKEHSKPEQEQSEHSQEQAEQTQS